MTDIQKIGDFGEEFSAAWYKKKHYDVLAVNYKTRLGELDLVLLKNKLIVVCEVKARRAGSMVSGREAVNHEKQRKIIAATKQFLVDFEIDSNFNIRFDVAEVVYTDSLSPSEVSVTVIENAFEAY